MIPKFQLGGQSEGSDVLRLWVVFRPAQRFVNRTDLYGTHFPVRETGRSGDHLTTVPAVHCPLQRSDQTDVSVGENGTE